jgi:hypothetical protein
VVRVDLGDGVSTEFAIEYERTLKSEQNHEKILEAIAGERRLHTILYLAPSYEIVATLRWYFQRTRHEILLAQVDDFKSARYASGSCEHLSPDDVARGAGPERLPSEGIGFRVNNL